MTSSTPTTATGMLRKKIQRQSAKVTIAPPMIGPMTGPSRAGMVITDIAPTSSSLGVVRSRTSRPTGIIIAPPMPWKIRAMTSWVRSWAKPHAADASAKSTIETMKTRLAPNLSATQPLIGRKTAEASRNMVIARFRRRGGSPSATAMVGRALAITVAFMVCMSMADPMIAGITQPRVVAVEPVSWIGWSTGLTVRTPGVSAAARRRRPRPRGPPAKGGPDGWPASHCAAGGPRRPGPRPAA